MPDDAPLILSLALDDEAQGRLDRLREAHFPPARNYLRAHLALFHHLPVAAVGQIAADGVLFFGRGVAYRFPAPDLVATGVALLLWRYRGCPWEPVSAHPFARP